MSTDLQRRNFAALFRVWDSDGDGQLNWADYEGVIDRFESELGISRDSEQHSQLESVFRRDWEELTRAADKDGSQSISLNEWNDYHDRMVADDGGYRVAVESFADMMLGLADSDGDGVLTKDEYAKILRAFNIDPGQADEAFARLDRDGDERMSSDELKQAAQEFFRPSGPDDPGNWVFGRPA